MPAKGLHSGVVEDGSYHHVYNKGVEKRNIFNDSQDYEVFIDYLKDYLAVPLDSEAAKKTFTVRGRTFRGTPHLPKNYLDKIELIAYSLLPGNFHLLLYQKTPGNLENFIRSLCTRYSIYYNKKYHHNGGLFDGPYKSIQIKDTTQLLVLTHYFHRNVHSSYPEYSGKRDSSWLNTNIVLSVMGLPDYRHYVEKYELSQKEKELLDGITLENKELERREVESTFTNASNTGHVANLKPFSRIPEVLGIVAVFLLLLGLGLRNISNTNAKNLAEASITKEPSVLSESTQPTASPEPKNVVIVKISDGADSVNIRQNPTTDSEKIGEAKNGDTFEFVSLNLGWYEIKLADGVSGFISSMYAFPQESNNQ